MNRKLLYLLLPLLNLVAVQAMGQDSVEMADALRSNGKIYVVVTVAFIVMTGILSYLVYLDRKLKRLEDQVKERK